MHCLYSVGIKGNSSIYISIRCCSYFTHLIHFFFLSYLFCRSHKALGSEDEFDFEISWLVTSAARNISTISQEYQHHLWESPLWPWTCAPFLTIQNATCVQIHAHMPPTQALWHSAFPLFAQTTFIHPHHMLLFICRSISRFSELHNVG